MYLLAPGNKGTSNAYRTGYERIWGKRKGDVEHEGRGVLSVCVRPDSRRLEHFHRNPDHRWDV